MKGPMKFYHDEMFYIEKASDGVGLKVTRKSNGEVLADNTMGFSWMEGRGYARSNRSFERKLQKRATKVKLIKR